MGNVFTNDLTLADRYFLSKKDGIKQSNLWQSQNPINSGCML